MRTVLAALALAPLTLAITALHAQTVTELKFASSAPPTSPGSR